MDLSTRPNPLRLNLGAGGKVIPGYLNVDVDGTPDIKSDVRKLPFEDDEVDEIMAIHIFEHLYLWDAAPTLVEWRRVLKPGGRLILEMPDLIKSCQNILAGREPQAGMWGLYGNPDPKNELMCHHWGWSSDELVKLLRSVGFTKCKVLPPQFHKKYRDMRVEALA